MEQPYEVKFKTSRFWVKAYDLPCIKQTVAFMGNSLEKFMDFDEATIFGIDKALCFRVYLDVSKPLWRGMRILMGKTPTWIKIKYVSSQISVIDMGR